jgi:hypothetical protein
MSARASAGKRKNNTENENEGVKKANAGKEGKEGKSGKSGKEKEKEEEEEEDKEEGEEKEEEEEEEDKEGETPVRRWHREVFKYAKDHNLEPYVVVGVYEKGKDSDDEEVLKPTLYARNCVLNAHPLY